MSNEYYDSTGYPQTGVAGSSASMRAELDLIETGFNKLPTITGNGGKLVKVNAAATGLEASSVISDNGTDATVSGDLFVAGGQIGQNAGQKHTIPLTANDVIALIAAVQTLTNKTINLTSNTLSGTLAQFNAALSGADFASLAGAETLTNKTIVAASNTITTAASGNLAATNLNAALAELQTDIDTRSTSAALTAHINDTTDAHAASAITNAPTGNLAAVTVQAALDELQADVDTRATAAALTAHINNAAGAHAASAISNTPSGNLAATNVQAALNELQTDIDTRALNSGLTTTNTNLTNHLNDTVDAHDASAISNVPSGNLAATTVQAALDELQTDVDTRVTAATVAAGYQPLDAELTALAGLVSAADRLPYFTGLGAASLATFTAFARTLLDDADATAMRATLGLVIGTNVQAYDAELAAIAGLVSAADRLPYFTGSGAASLATFTAAGRALVDDADAAAQRATLGLVIGTNVQAYDADLAAIAALADPNADRILFWDDSLGAYAYLTVGAGLVITGTTIESTGATFSSDAEYITGTETNKSISPAVARNNNLVLGTAIATTSGTSHDFTGIPSWVKKITVQLVDVSTNGTSPVVLQIGDSGGIENTNYRSAASAIQGTAVGCVDFTTGFGLNNDAFATYSLSGAFILTKFSGNKWVISGVARTSSSRVSHAGGDKTLSGTLDRVRLTTVGGTDTFDTGAINIIYE